MRPEAANSGHRFKTWRTNKTQKHYGTHPPPIVNNGASCAAEVRFPGIDRTNFIAQRKAIAPHGQMCEKNSANVVIPTPSVLGATPTDEANGQCLQVAPHPMGWQFSRSRSS